MAKGYVHDAWVVASAMILLCLTQGLYHAVGSPSATLLVVPDHVKIMPLHYHGQTGGAGLEHHHQPDMSWQGRVGGDMETDQPA